MSIYYGVALQHLSHQVALTVILCPSILLGKGRVCALFFLRPPLTHLGSARTRAFPCRVLWKKNFIPRQDQVKLFATNQISNKSYINNTGHFALIHRSCLAKHGNGGSLQVLLSPRYFILLNRACV